MCSVICVASLKALWNTGNSGLSLLLDSFFRNCHSECLWFCSTPFIPPPPSFSGLSDRTAWAQTSSHWGIQLDDPLLRNTHRVHDFAGTCTLIIALLSLF